MVFRKNYVDQGKRDEAIVKVETKVESVSNVQADAIVVGIWENEPLDGVAAELDQATDGTISRLVESGEISAARESISTVLGQPGVTSQVIIVVGLGQKADADATLAYRVAGTAAKHLATKPRSKVVFFIDVESKIDAVCGSIVGSVGQDIYRQEKKLNPIENIVWANVDQKVVDEGVILGECVNFTRRLVNLPPNDLYPQSFAEVCVTAGKDSGFEVEVWDRAKLEEEKCGALLAVAKASDREPRLVIMRYMGGPEGQAPIGFVGKGVTFDSGGLSIKPSAGMLDMKCDMAGAATVAGALCAIARLKLPVNVIGFAGLAENMIGGNAYRLGDVLTARSGKTIEVHNTDAEGRLVLADTLDVAVEMGVEKIVDLATLTGSCVVALGLNTVGLMTNNQEFAKDVVEAATETGEAVWQLPMFAEFGEQIKSSVADIKNTGEGRWGGAITAGKFLEEFVRDTPWVHLDIAGPSFADKPKGWLDAGASGCMLRTLVQLVR